MCGLENEILGDTRAIVLVHLSTQLSFHPLLRDSSVNLWIPDYLSIYQASSSSIQPELSCTDTRSVIHSSVSQSISHPSIQSASAESGWTNQSGQVMWVMKRKRQIHRKSWSHDPHIISLWLILWLFSSFCLHSPVSPFSQPLLFKVLTHHFTESGLQPLQRFKLL